MPNIFERVKQGVKTTFGIKELTPQQKADNLAKQKSENEYRQKISESQKQAWQMAYQQELIRQRQLNEEIKDKEAIARGMAKARQEVQSMNAPKQTWLGKTMAGVTKFQQGVGKIFPAPPSNAQTRLKQSMSNSADITLGAPSGWGGMGQPQQYGRRTYGRARTRQPKMTAQQSWLARETGGMVQPYSYSAQAIGQRLHKRHKPHLKHLGTSKGGVSVVVNGTEIRLNPATSKVKSGRRVRHLKNKLKYRNQQPANQLGDMVWKL